MATLCWCVMRLNARKSSTHQMDFESITRRSIRSSNYLFVCMLMFQALETYHYFHRERFTRCQTVHYSDVLQRTVTILSHVADCPKMRRSKVGLKGVQIRRCTVNIPFPLSTPNPVSHPHLLQSSQPGAIGSTKPLDDGEKTRGLQGVMTNEGRDEEYEVELILDRRETTEMKEYLVKWKGWEDEEDRTWEPEEHLKGAAELVRKFERNRIKYEHGGRNAEHFKPLQRIDDENNQVS